MPEVDLAGFDSPYHAPVMWREVCEIFSSSAGVVVDGTLGGGGHASALLASNNDLAVIGVDRDPVAVEFASVRLAGFGTRAQVRRASFRDLDEVLFDDGVRSWIADRPLAGGLFDLGVSSRQLDDPARGFSFRDAGPLDMRMDAASGLSLADYLRQVDEHVLAAAIAENGEPRYARTLAKRIKRAMASGRLHTTADLREVVAEVVGRVYAQRRIDPATKVFQALRIEVNEEMEALEELLEKVPTVFAPPARVCVISYHSGEDQRVKRAFVEMTEGGCRCPKDLPCVCGAQVVARRLGGMRRPQEDEVRANPRARSAKLRAIEMIEPVAVAELRGL
ncbi:MAG: 16S rRNA (cytosine(1402)-N(4))-methyltransferase RsmH [Actinomycetota bacterium]|nr:16S rRNA (cytosine(1402)-N(4))-methyltransferase RsmH [Actinomycetota bacterium]